MIWNTILKYFKRVNEQSVLWPWTPYKPTLSLLQLLPSKKNSLRNGLLNYKFWVKCFFGLEELKNNKHFPPISSNCWPSAEPLLPSAILQPPNIVGCVVPVCYLFLMLSDGFSLTKQDAVPAQISPRKKVHSKYLWGMLTVSKQRKSSFSCSLHFNLFVGIY